MRFRLRKHENLYQDPVAGCYVAEIKLYPRDIKPEWIKLGCFRTRAAAQEAIVRTRPPRPHRG
jgi:hypothetical protein